MLISCIDTYYSYIKAQMLTLSAQVYVNGATIAQPMGGVVEARDWPQTPPLEGGLYLLMLNMMPVGGTEAQIEYVYNCQWVWDLIGTDLTAEQRAQNRGDRYRAGMQIMENLRQANYPGFCQKKDYSSDSQGVVSAVNAQSLYPISKFEAVRWSRLRFMPRTDSSRSGLTFGAAAVDLYGYSDVSTLVA